LLDQRFLTPHPATQRWWRQRDVCQRCTNRTVQPNHAWMCKESSMVCIDARSPGQVCGPDAKRFSPKA
jgi:hypothetical protein